MPAGAVGSVSGGIPTENEPEEDEGAEPTEQKPEEPEQGPSGFRDSFRDSFAKERDKAKKPKKKAGEKAGKKAGEKLAEKAAEKGVETAGTAAGGAVLPIIGAFLGKIAGKIAGKLLTNKKVHYALIVILLGLLMMILIPAGGITLSYMDGGLTGGSSKIETDLSNPDHQATIEKIEAYTNQNGECGKRLEFADPEDLELIKKGEVDYRVLLAIKRLTVENNHIKISHVMHLMTVIPANTIETHSDVEEKYLDNISAHKDGMAFDIVEINCVYEKCACNQQCGCTKIPVQVAWQDKGNLPGIARDAGLDQVTELLGLPDGALNGNSVDEIFESTGLSQLERQFKVAEGIFDNVQDLPEFVLKYGQAEIEKALRLPPGSLKDRTSLTNYASDIGRRQMEQILKLPGNSLTGSQPTTVERNTGKETVEEELNIPKDMLLKKPKEAYQYIKNLGLTSEEKKSIEQKLGWPSGTINNLMDDLKDGNVSGVNSSLTEVGKNVLEQALGLLGGELDNEGSPPFTPGQGTGADYQKGLPEGTFTSFVSALKNGQSINQTMISVGGKELDEGMSLAYGSVSAIISGQKTPEQVLNQSDIYGSYSDSYIASRLGIAEAKARELKKMILSGESTASTALNIGIDKITKQFELQAGSLSSLINGSLSADNFIKINGSSLEKKAEALGIPDDALNKLFAGDISGAAIEYGKFQIADTFSFDIDDFISWAQSGNFEALIQNEVIQAVSKILGIDAGIIGGILTGNVNPEALISIGFSMLFGGPLGGIFGGVFGGIFGGTCSTSCYQSEARKNIRKVISQLLDMGEQDTNLKPIQIITLKDSDVAHFGSRVDDLYGEDRQPNYGLFSRDEMRNHIHIGY